MNLPNNREEPTRAEQMGRFRLRGRLGETGRSCVFVAEASDQAGRRELFTLRQIPTLRVGDRRPLAAVLEFARRVATLRHPNLVAIHEVGQGEGVGYVAMDFVAGEDLDTIVTHPAGRGMPPEIALALVTQIADALRYQQEVQTESDAPGEAGRAPLPPVHPRDVFVGYDGVVRVLAPGLVVHGEAGGPQYQAPEILGGAAGSEASTVFCLGIVLWECLAGRFLFVGRRGETPGSAVLLRPIEGPSAFRPEISKEVDAVVLRALDRDPARRFPGLQELVRALDQVAQQGIRATREGVGLWMRALFGAERGALKARIALGKDVERSIRRLRALELGGGTLGGGTPISGVRLRPLWTNGGEGQASEAPASEASSVPEGKATPAGGTPAVEEDFSNETYDEPPTALKSAPPSGKGRRLGVWTTLGAVVLVAAGGAFGWWQHQSRARTVVAGSPAAGLGRLEIKSQPPGALIVVDGVPSGLFTPAALSQLRVGRTLRLDLQKAGYQSAGRELTIADDKPRSLELVLREANGRLVLEKLPKKARVFVDDVEMNLDGSTSAEAQAGLVVAVGIRRLRVERGSAVLLEREVEIKAGTTRMRIEPGGSP